MKSNQLNRGENRRVMYVENKVGKIDGVRARIGWVSFSHTGRTVYHRDKQLQRSKGQGILGNYFDVETGEEYWISGIKVRGSNAHWTGRTDIKVDVDAIKEYKRIKRCG